MELEFYDLYYAAREAQILWKKRRQHAEGKINLHVGDDGLSWDVEECNEMLDKYAKVERWLWKQLPERSQIEGDVANYLVTSVRLVFDPPC